MKNIVAICQLRLLQLKNNRKQLFLLLIMPPLALFLIQLFVSETIDQAKLPIAFVDEDGSDLSEQLAMSLVSIDVLDVVYKQYDEAEQLLLQHDVDVVIYVESGFEERILKAEADSLVTLMHSPMSLSIGVMKEVVASKLMKFVSNSLAANYVLDLAKEFSPSSLVNEEKLLSEAWEKTNAQWEPMPPLDLVVQGDEMLIVPINNEEVGGEQSGLLLLMNVILIISIYLSTTWLDSKQGALVMRLRVHRATNLEQFFGHVSALIIQLIVLSILPIFTMSMTNSLLISDRLFLSLMLFIVASAVLFYSFSTLFIKKYLYASISALLLLGSILLSAISELTPQRVVLSMNNSSVSIMFVLGYFGLGLILSLLLLIISSRLERGNYC